MSSISADIVCLLLSGHCLGGMLYSLCLFFGTSLPARPACNWPYRPPLCGEIGAALCSLPLGGQLSGFMPPASFVQFLQYTWPHTL